MQRGAAGEVDAVAVGVAPHRAVPGQAGRQDAVEQVDAEPGVAREIGWMTHSHEITWLGVWELRNGGFEEFGGDRFGLADAQAADGEAGWIVGYGGAGV